MIATETRHLQRVGDATTRLLGEVLDVGVHVVVRDEDGVERVELGANVFLQGHALGDRQRGWLVPRYLGGS